MVGYPKEGAGKRVWDIYTIGTLALSDLLLPYLR